MEKNDLDFLYYSRPYLKLIDGKQNNLPNVVEHSFKRLLNHYSTVKPGQNWNPFLIQFDGYHFLLCSDIDEHNINWWIKILGSKADADKYSLVFTLRNLKDGSTMRVSYNFKIPLGYNSIG